MSNPRSEAVRVTRTLLPFALIMFLGYATVGLPLSTVPLLVHGPLGFGTAVVGVMIGLAPVTTLCTRQIAGRLADRRGSKFGLVAGLLTVASSGVLSLLALGLPPGGALALLIAGRIVLGLGDSLFTTALNLWMVVAAGTRHAGRAMSWAGIAMYAALAVGAPLGTVLYAHSFVWVTIAVIVSPLLGLPIALSLRALPVVAAKPVRFFAVIGRMWPPGLGLVLASGGFGTIAAFLALRFAAMHWDGAGLALTAFGAVYIASRLSFAGLPDRLGGILVATLCLCIEAAGLLAIALAPSALVATIGTGLAGLGYSMVFPALGVEVVRRVSPESRGVALSAYLACFDLGLGAAGPVMGVIAGGSSLPAAFIAAAIASLASLVLVRTTRRVGVAAAE
jgi:MFS family permease